MASVVGIANRALQKLGVQGITSLTENSRNARAVNAAYDSVRTEELEAHPWNFACARGTLPADSPPPDWGRANTFTVPSNFLRLLPDYEERLRGDDDFQIEGRKITSNFQAPLEIRYIKDVTDPNVMTPLFREVLACKLAIEMCEQITGSNSKLANVQAQYDLAIRKAKRTNAFQNRPAMSPDDTFISCRR